MEQWTCPDHFCLVRSCHSKKLRLKAAARGEQGASGVDGDGARAQDPRLRDASKKSTVEREGLEHSLGTQSRGKPLVSPVSNEGCRLRRREGGETRAQPWNPVKGRGPLHPPVSIEVCQSTTALSTFM